MEVVCTVESSYFWLLSKREKRTKSPLIPEQTVLLYSPKDDEEVGGFIQAALPHSDPQIYFSLLPKHQNYWLLQEFQPSAIYSEWNLKLNALLRACTSLDNTRVLFLQPTAALQTTFSEAGIDVILEYLMQNKDKCVHITLLAPNPEFYRKVKLQLSKKGLCCPHNQVTMSSEALLAGYLSAAKCISCERFAIQPVYSSNFPTKCLLCTKDKPAPPTAEGQILDKIAGKAMVTCRCGEKLSAAQLDTHTLSNCPRKEWFCLQHRKAIPSGEEFLEHYLSLHFEEVVGRLGELVQGDRA
jgi:hypothetical protein